MDLAQLGFLWKILSPILTESAKQQLKPKTSPETARSLAFRLYTVTGELARSIDAFIAAFETEIEWCRELKSDTFVETVTDHMNAWPLEGWAKDVIVAMEKVATVLNKMNPQLEIHQNEIYGMLQNVRVSEALVLEAEHYRFLEANGDPDAMAEVLLIAKQNARDAHKALDDLRKFIASEFSFKDSF